MEKLNNVISNYFAINEVRKVDNGNVQVSGILTIYDDTEANANGYVYKRGCYDNFCKSYYEQKGKNIPLDLLHNTGDIYHLAGKVVEFISDDDKVVIIAEISKHAPLFDNIVGMIEDGILQGFSDMSYINDAEESGGLLHVNECSVVSIALVPVPAVGASTLELKNATKFTFKKQQDADIAQQNRERVNSIFFGL